MLPHCFGAPFSVPYSLYTTPGSLSPHHAPSCRARSRCSCLAGVAAPRPSGPSCGAGGRGGGGGALVLVTEGRLSGRLPGRVLRA